MTATRLFFPALKGIGKDAQNIGAYYEAAWVMRAAVMDSMIAAGETCLVRVLSRFRAYEQRTRLVPDMDGGKLTGWLEWVPIPQDWPWRGVVRLEGGVPAILRGQEVASSAYVDFDVSRMIADFADDADTILELGSGYGLQLFNLFHAGGPADARYIGAEISPAGRSLAQRLAALEPALNYQSVAFDLLRPDWSMLSESRKALIFSAWSLMYPQHLPDDFFETLCQWPGEATLVFCEPLGFQWGVSHPLSGLQQQKAFNGGANLNLAALARDAGAKGLIEPLVVAKDVFAKRHDDASSLFSVLVYSKPKS